MKVLLLVSSMGSGGAERVAATLANAWTTRGYQVTLMPTFSGRGDCFYTLLPKVRLIYLADLIYNKSRNLFNQLVRLNKLRRFMADERPDVIVSFLSNVNVAAVIASAGLDLPIIICERVDPFVMPSSRLLKLACCLTYPYANALMVQTQSVANKYALNGWMGRLIPVIPNPVPEHLLSVQSTLVNKNKRLLSIGRFDEQKQFDVLIKVFATIASNHKDWSLRIIGDGPLREALVQQVAANYLLGRVEFPGRSSNIVEELSQADAFVLTSAYEGFPNALLEAMAVGLPCVAFDCPSGPREMSEEGQVAVLVPLNDEQQLAHELDCLMADDEARKSLGNKARASVIERYGLAKILEQWDALFQEVGIKL
jgi:GalNAc-alpha-(1->4)-GalNAc-alpha-(1->3)-diNAcBac-PP-undecaprenol alpha-1,4-N-acetyl-D-galactosaminyltransferase